MALSQPVLPFLRPLGPPKHSTFRHLFGFSTSSRLRSDLSPPNAKSSSTTTIKAPTDTPAISSDSPIRTRTQTPQERAADLAAAEASTDADSAQSPTSKPHLPSRRASKPSRQSKSSRQEPEKLQFHVARTGSNNLPIYTDWKRGGNLHQTLVRKITGDKNALKNALKQLLQPKQEKDIVINPLTGHLVVKGHHKETITKYLESKGL